MQPLRNHRQDLPHHHANVWSPSLRPRLDMLKPKRWQWWSCECHRSGPYVMSMAPHRSQPNRDECHQGGSDYCKFWPGGKQDNSFLGAMGWLLSCRQALELIFPIFNRTLGSAINTYWPAFFKVSPLKPFSLQLRRGYRHPLFEEHDTYGQHYHDPPPTPVAPPTATRQHLRLFQDSEPYDPLDSVLAVFHSLLDALPSTFPHLRKLSVSLEGVTKNMPLTKLIEASESVIMTPVDDMLRRLGPFMQECHVALPLLLYEPRRYKTTAASLALLESSIPDEWCRFWRELSQTKMEDDGPGTAHSRGYWVVLGQTDVQYGQLRFIRWGYWDAAR